MQRVSRHRSTTAKELHRQLRDAGIERDIRSIQRILKFLVEHFDVECDYDTKPYRYRWKKNAQGILIPSLGLNEALMLTLAERFLRDLVPSGTLPSLESVLDRADERIEKQELHKQWLEKVRYAYPTPILVPPQVDQQVLDVVSECLFNNRRLRLQYTNRTGEQRDWIVSPLGLVSRAQVLYLIAVFDDNRTPYRFALHRINAVHATTIAFVPPDDFDIDKCIAQYGFTPSTGKTVQLDFHIDQRAGQHLTESKLSEDQTCDLIGSEYHITATVLDSVELRHWLRGFGNEIRNVLIDGVPLNFSYPVT